MQFGFSYVGLVFLIMLGGSLASDFVGFVTTITREILFRLS